MLEVGRFYGISIRLYYRDQPPAHIHAHYGDQEALIDIETGQILKGQLPKTACELINAWRAQHLQELRNNWERARQRLPILPVPPLE